VLDARTLIGGEKRKQYRRSRSKMGRKKLWRNPRTTDAQRDRVLKRRILEERAKAFAIWKRENSKTISQKIVDYLKGKKISHHITERILRGVIFGPKYGMTLFPKNPQEKYFDVIGQIRMSHLISSIRLNPKFKWVSVSTEIASPNPDTQDLEYVIFDFAAEQGRKINRTESLTEWEVNRREIEDTKAEITTETIERALTPEPERRRLEREEKDRRTNNNSEDEE
jgi:hypothetical protein